MSEPTFIIRYRGQFPVTIVTNASGKRFDLTSEERATPFTTEKAAYQAARAHGIEPGNITVAPRQSLGNGFVNLVCPICKKVHQPMCRK